MKRPCVILGIETSCDETSAAVVIDGYEVRSNVVSSQVALHARYGGVVPEIAARAHVEQIAPIIEQALSDAKTSYDQLDAVAVTDGPGLVGSLLVGVTAAKMIALRHKLPLVPVDHVQAHCTSAALVSREPPWPAIALVVSGGHTSLYLVRDFLDIELLGQTMDDAAGEAFDKVAAILELGYPGGPGIEQAAEGGDPKRIRFPRTWLDEPHYNFSYSGLKTAVLYHVYGVGKKYGSAEHLSPQQLADIAASFQAALIEPLVRKTVRAAVEQQVSRVVVGGGVAANTALRDALAADCNEHGLRLLLTPRQYCTDNAAMIAAAGFHRLQGGLVADLTVEPRAGLIRKGRPGGH